MARSSRHGLLEPFRPLLLSWTQRGEMATLTGAESGVAPVALAGRALWCGFYCNELLMRLLPRQDAASELWEVYSETLVGLTDPGRQPGSLRRFELALLGELGAVPDLTTDAESGEPVNDGMSYLLDPESGPRVDTVGSRGIVSGASLRALSERAFDDTDVMHAARTVTRLLLEGHLDGRPLKTRELFI